MGCDLYFFKLIFVSNSIFYVYFCVNYVILVKIMFGLVKFVNKNFFCKFLKIFLNMFFKEDMKVNRF